jgi:antibiotic biosynthesis monooxygenase (ABM) superfamily enzyme
MICRIWNGWTTVANAAAYEAVVRTQVIPEIEARRIPGFRQIDLLRRELPDEVQFTTLMWFDDHTSVRTFIGEDYNRSHVPSAARAVLSRYDERVSHFEVLDRRLQSSVDS